MCQPSGAIRAAMPLEHVARREIDQARHEVEAHAVHAGAVHRLELGVGDLRADEGDALRALSFDASSASTSARLSVPWQLACTITFLSKPRKSRSANSFSLGASHGVYLRSGA